MFTQFFFFSQQSALVLAWITYCMFFKEKPKSELNHYDISDIQCKNQQILQEPVVGKKKRELMAGIFILPGRRAHHKKDTYYDKRPDYPESPVPALQTGADDLVKVFNDCTLEAGATVTDNKEYCYEIDSGSQYHSDV